MRRPLRHVGPRRVGARHADRSVRAAQVPLKHALEASAPFYRLVVGNELAAGVQNLRGERERLAARRRARVEHAVAGLRRERERRQHRGAVEVVVRRPTVVESRRLRKLLVRRHQRDAGDLDDFVRGKYACSHVELVHVVGENCACGRRTQRIQQRDVLRRTEHRLAQCRPALAVYRAEVRVELRGSTPSGARVEGAARDSHRRTRHAHGGANCERRGVNEEIAVASKLQSYDRIL